MRKAVLALSFLLLVCQTALAVLDNGQSYVWQGVIEDSPYAAYWDTPYYMDIYPRGYYQNGYTFVAWQDTHRDPKLLRYNHSTRQLDFSSNTPANDVMYNSNIDSHGNPAVMVDGDGYVHIFFGCHVTPMLHYKSNTPYAIDAWTQQTSVDTQATYPQILKQGSNYVVSYRDGNYDWGYKTSSDNLSTFSSFNQIWDSTDANNRWYAQVAYRPDGKLAFSATWCDVETTIRTNVYYVYLDGSTWKNAAGNAVTIPITKDSADSECLAYSTNDLDIDLGRPVFDSNNNPYLKYKYASTSNWGIAYWTGSAWSSWESTLYVLSNIKIENDKVCAVGRYQSESTNVTKFIDLLGGSPTIKKIVQAHSYGSLANMAFIDNAASDLQWVFYTKPSGQNIFYLYLYGQHGLIGQVQSQFSGTIQGIIR